MHSLKCLLLDVLKRGTILPGATHIVITLLAYNKSKVSDIFGHVSCNAVTRCPATNFKSDFGR